MSPSDLPRMPLYGLYVSPLSFSCSILSAENVCWTISKRILNAREGRGCFALNEYDESLINQGR